MRVANQTIFDTVKFNLANLAEDLNKASMVTSTGKRVTDLSDDPIATVQTLKVKSTMSHIDQMGRNISQAKVWLSASEAALNQAQDLITDARTLCVQMADANAGTTERLSAALNVENTMKQMLVLANKELDGRYIFAGSKTDTTPFTQDGTYQGDNKPFSVKIGRDTIVEIGNDGEAIFGNVFKTLSGLKKSLEANSATGIRAAMTELEYDADRTTIKVSDIGAKVVRMEMKESIYQEMNIAATNRLSGLEDADMAEAIIKLQSVELAYQAAMASSSIVMKLSLVDYL